ncbi:hypothetical protein E2C01_079154 [Portunus trituberculatus]|uniref:Uncharacterized protein n=1 Tax=Portunus trituberculatus TaxID=210409 RepID=A0A5B7IPI9_PORTR|nr:hypothetical protein [Portunus trituberculatus]
MSDVCLVPRCAARRVWFPGSVRARRSLRVPVVVWVIGETSYRGRKVSAPACCLLPPPMPCSLRGHPSPLGRGAGRGGAGRVVPRAALLGGAPCPARNAPTIIICVGMANGTADAPCVFVSVSGLGNGGVRAEPGWAVPIHPPRSHGPPQRS